MYFIVGMSFVVLVISMIATIFFYSLQKKKDKIKNPKHTKKELTMSLMDHVVMGDTELLNRVNDLAFECRNQYDSAKYIIEGCGFWAIFYSTDRYTQKTRYLIMNPETMLFFKEEGSEHWVDEKEAGKAIVHSAESAHTGVLLALRSLMSKEL